MQHANENRQKTSQMEVDLSRSQKPAIIIAGVLLLLLSIVWLNRIYNRPFCPTIEEVRNCRTVLPDSEAAENENPARKSRQPIDNM